MTATATYSNGRPDFDWEVLLQNVLANGSLDDTNTSAVTLTAGSTTLTLIGTGIEDIGGDGLLDSGTISQLILTSPDGTLTLTFSTPAITAADVNAMITGAVGLDPYSEAFKALLAPLADVEAINATGSGADDSIFGSTFGGDTIDAGDGNDYLRTYGQASGGGADAIHGGAGDDFLDLYYDGFGDGVIVDLVAGTVINRTDSSVAANIDGIESVGGTGANDEIYGDGNNNVLLGHEGDDYLEGGDGDDFLVGGNGSDGINGGNGWDKVSYDSDTGGNGIIVNVQANQVIDSWGNTDFVWNVEGYKGSQYADTFNGFVWDDYFEGLEGNDTFNGGGGRDYVDYQFEVDFGGVLGVVVDLGAGTATDAFGDADTLNGISDIGGTNVGDSITGNEGRNQLEGRGGDDTLNGAGGDDDLNGGDGNDTINGGEGRDFIDGGRGNDTVNAGSGQFDFIRGSSGSDTVDGDAGYDMLAFDSNNDEDGDGDPDHDNDSIAVILNTAGTGTGTVTGLFGQDDSDVDLSVGTDFSNLERARGTKNADTFTGVQNFVATDESDRTFGDIRGQSGIFSVTGGDGADTFTDGFHSLLVDYDEEKWTHDDFDDEDGRRWGDLGELGVAVNASGTNRSSTDFVPAQLSGGTFDFDENSTPDTILANTAIDTFGNADSLSGITAFRLTDAQDFFWAGNGDTYVEAGRGDDFFQGGSGNDQFNGREGSDYADGGAGIDNLNGDDGNDELHGGAGNDNLNGHNGDDWLYGDGGKDNIEGGDGNDIIEGGTGNDDIRGDNGDDNLKGDDGDDQIEGGDGNDLLDGGTGDDRLRGGSNDDTLVGAAGHDELEGDDGDDVLYGDDLGSTNAVVGNDRLRGGGGNDSLYGGYGDDYLWGHDGNDTLRGGFGVDELNGDSGLDILYGEAGDDNLNGGTDNDTLNGGDGADELGGGDGSDILNGDAHDDYLYGGEGNDTLNGGTGNDILDGDNGNDTLVGSLGNDRYYGGAGNDTYALGNSAVLDIWDQSGIDTVTTTITRSLSAPGGWGTIENATMSAGGTGNLTGNALGNVLNGSLAASANQLIGLGGNDTYIIGAGDTVNETAAGSGGIDTVQSLVTHTLGTNVEKLTLLGTGAINGTGNTLANTIIGNAGANVINGGLGNDILTGGSGADFFVFNTTLNAATNKDTITDFNVAADGIRLDNLVMAGLGVTLGTLAAAKFWKNTTGAAHDADDRIIYETDTGKLFYDSNGTAAGGAVQIGQLTANLALTNADFFVI